MVLNKDELYTEIQTRLNTSLALVIRTGCPMSIHSHFGMEALESHLDMVRRQMPILSLKALGSNSY